MPGKYSSSSRKSNRTSNIHSIGCSLWLLPPSNAPIRSILSDLITTKFPSLFPTTRNLVFEPHLTLTSDISLPSDLAAGKQAQRWLDDVPLPSEVNVDVRFQSLDVGAQYFKKLTLSVDKRPLEAFAAHIRSTAVENRNMEAATSWAKAIWAPHVSLMYADVGITAEERQETLRLVIGAGVRMEKEHILVEDVKCDFSAWHGGRIALVETWKQPRDWKVIASRAV